jgi:hypothetical protein
MARIDEVEGAPIEELGRELERLQGFFEAVGAAEVPQILLVQGLNCKCKSKSLFSLMI